MRRCPYCGIRHIRHDVWSKALLWTAIALGMIGVLIAFRLMMA